MNTNSTFLGNKRRLCYVSQSIKNSGGKTMKLKEYRFWPNNIDGKPTSGKVMIIVVMLGILFGQMIYEDPSQRSYYTSHIGIEYVYAFIVVAAAFLVQKK